MRTARRQGSSRSGVSWSTSRAHADIRKGSRVASGTQLTGETWRMTASRCYRFGGSMFSSRIAPVAACHRGGIDAMARSSDTGP